MSSICPDCGEMFDLPEEVPGHRAIVHKIGRVGSGNTDTALRHELEKVRAEVDSLRTHITRIESIVTKLAERFQIALGVAKDIRARTGNSSAMPLIDRLTQQERNELDRLMKEIPGAKEVRDIQDS